MKFCPECGILLKVESSKICVNCGTTLFKLVANDNTHSNLEKSSFGENLSQDNRSLEQEDWITKNRQDYTTTIHDLGIKLEEAVETILKHKGFSTQKRLKLKGRSGAFHEIDVFAKQKNQAIAVECKNYSRDRIVAIKEIRDFQSKLNDLHHNDDAIFVTYAKFSSEAITYANKYDIQLWDRDALSKIYLEMMIGRSIAPGDSKKILLDAALPISMTFEEVTDLNLQNPNSAKITGSLILLPYYVADYRLDSLTVDKRGKTHRIKAEGNCIIDAFTEHFLYQIENSPNKDPHILLSKRLKQETDLKKELEKVEQNQILKDLLYIEPQINYEMQESKDYSIEIVQPQLSTKTVKNAILGRIIERNTKEITYTVKKSKDKLETKSIIIVPKKNDITFRKFYLVYVPKWVIEIQSHTITYRRRALAASGTITLDEIAICPKDFSALKIWTKKKSTHALCEVCGIALCLEHIHKHNEKYYCKDHSK